MERLKPCIGKLTSPFQIGFVPGRSIHENVIIAREVMNRIQRKQGRKGFFGYKDRFVKSL